MLCKAIYLKGLGYEKKRKYEEENTWTFWENKKTKQKKGFKKIKKAQITEKILKGKKNETKKCLTEDERTSGGGCLQERKNKTRKGTNERKWQNKFRIENVEQKVAKRNMK